MRNEVPPFCTPTTISNEMLRAFQLSENEMACDIAALALTEQASGNEGAQHPRTVRCKFAMGAQLFDDFRRYF